MSKMEMLLKAEEQLRSIVVNGNCSRIDLVQKNSTRFEIENVELKKKVLDLLLIECNKLLKEEIKKYILNGGQCFYRYGWGWKGAKEKPITKEQALEYLPKYGFGMGFYEICVEKIGIVFNQYSECDML